MSQAVSQFVPCLGNAKPYYCADRESPIVFDTKNKVALVASSILAVAGFVLLPFLPPVGGTCLVASGVGFISLVLFNLVKSIRPPNSVLADLEQLETAKQLATGIEISPALQQELEQIIPAIDAMEDDARIGSIRYNHDLTATFTLKTAPDLQFRISAAESRSLLGCCEVALSRRYENTIYAHEICRNENYDSLVISPIKPVYVKADGLRRSMLVEKVIERAAGPAGDLERAVRQMVQFLLKTGGAGLHDPIPFLPLEGNKLALQNLHHLTGNPHPDASTRDAHEVDAIIHKSNSLLASLNSEEMIEIALDELKKSRPTLRYDSERGALLRHRQIEGARESRLNQIRQHLPDVNVHDRHIVPSNILRVSPEELGLNLGLKDYAVMKREGIHSDGICRVIVLREVAQAIIDCINRKLEADPTNYNIEFTPKDMLIGEELPIFTWEKHCQYNMLQGLGYRGWPDPNHEPTYWIALVLESLKNKGIINDFTLPPQSNPRLSVNPDAIVH